MSSDTEKINKPNGDWKAWLFKQGVGYVFLAVVLWFVGYKIFLPMQAAHIQAVDSLAKTNVENSDTLRQQTSILDRIERAVSK